MLADLWKSLEYELSKTSSIIQGCMWTSLIVSNKYPTSVRGSKKIGLLKCKQSD